MQGINLYGPINPTGYGVHTKNLVAHASSLCDLRLYPIGQPTIPNDDTKKPIEQAICRGHDNYSASLPGVCLWHAYDMARFHGSPRIAYTVFELDKLRSQEVKHLNQVDHIIVPTNWAADIVRDECSGIPVWVVPEGVNPHIYCYEEDREIDLSSGVTMLNIGKFEQRKGHIHILDMMANKNVTCDLIALWDNFFIRPEEIEATIRAYGFGAPKISYLDNDQLNPRIPCKIFEHPNYNRIYYVSSNHNDPNFIKDIIPYADVGLFPYLAEGWNLPLIECMSAGLPCIATDYSGPTEYLTPNNHIPLTNQGLIPASDGKFFRGEGKWASVSVDEMSDIVFNLKEVELDRINAELKGFGEQWKWQNAAQQFVQTVTQILEDSN